MVSVSLPIGQPLDEVAAWTMLRGLAERSRSAALTEPCGLRLGAGGELEIVTSDVGCVWVDPGADPCFGARTPLAPGVLMRYVTGSLKVDFRKPTPLGVELELRARVREATERKAVVDGPADATHKLVTETRLPSTLAMNRSSSMSHASSPNSSGSKYCSRRRRY